LRAGELRKQIILQVATITRGTDGSVVESWTTHDTVWASKANKGSRELYAAQKINAETTDLFIIRYRDLVNTRMRLVCDGRTYVILGTPDPDGRRRELQLLAKEVV
jgi:SPP1 family predicted phage head-tail adaptor